jgi:hypothetical protein
MIKHPNYTFSVPDKRLYTFFKGITVTPRFVRASSVSSHGRAAFTRDVSCLCFVQRPLHVQRAYVSRAPLTKPRLPPALHLRRRSSPRRHPDHVHMTCFRPPSERTRRIALSTYLYLWRRKPATFGAAMGGNCTYETTLT